MKGLFIKDLMTLGKYIVWYAVYCAAFTLIALISKNTAFIAGLAVLLPVSVCSATISADKKENWTEYSLACGMSPAAITAEKYLLTLIAAAVATALWPVAYFPVSGGDADLSGLAVTAALALVSGALALPLAYKFGAERGRLVLGIAMCALLVACVALLSAFGDRLQSAPPPLLAALPSAGAAAYVCSFFVAKEIIKR